MNFTKEIKCINCNETMKQGGSNVTPRGLSQYRYCGCGLSIILFTEDKGHKYSLRIEKKDGE